MTATTSTAAPAHDEQPAPGDAWGWPAIVVPTVFAIVVIIIVLDAMAGTTFFYDEWIWIMQRHSFDSASLLEPFNNHLMALPIATFSVFYRVFGLDSPLPYQLALLAGHVATCGLLYVYLRRRVGWIVGLAGAAALALFGYTWPVIIWPISLGWVYATTAGIGALLLVDRDTRRTDIGACVALLLAIASSGIAVPFVLGLGVELVLKRAWNRLYVALAPLVVFGAWYLGYATGTNDSGSVGDVVEFAEKLLAQTFGTLLGVDDRGSAAHVVLTIGFVAIVVLWFALGRPHSPRLIGNATALASFTVLLSYSRATSGLTQWHSYAAAVFLLLTLGELVAGRSFGVVPTALVVAVVARSIIWNLGELNEGSEIQRERADEIRAQLAAVELAGGSIDPNMRVGRFLLETRAGPWLEVAAEYGSPAFTLEELRDAPAAARRAADRLLVKGAGIALGPSALGGTCSGGAVIDQAGPLHVELDGGPTGTEVRVGALAAPRVVGRLEPGQQASLELPGLGGAQRWTVDVGESGVICSVTTDS